MEDRRILSREIRYGAHTMRAMGDGFKGQVPGYKPKGRLYAATDASWNRNKRDGIGGIGYIVTDGRWGLKAWGGGRTDPSGPSIVSVSELRAVWMLLRTGVQDVTILTDSANAMHYMTEWFNGRTSVMPDGYDLRKRVLGRPPTLVRLANALATRTDITIEKVTAHTGDLLNEAADSLAAIARSILDGDQRDPRERATRLVDGFLAAYHH